MPLGAFHPIVATWFAERFGAPTEPQAQGWASIAAGADTLIMAPTGSGKTLAAFLAGIDRLVRRALDGRLEDKTSIIYVSPLKALGADVARNLQAPLAGIEATAPRFGRLLAPISTAVRSGDSTAAERARIVKRPPHVLITTPESLYLLLTSAGGRAALGHVECVIVDEIHAMLGGKRGAHLALSLERLDQLVTGNGGRRPQRVGLSATVEPPEEAGRFLAGCTVDGAARPYRLIDAGRAQPLDVAVCVPSETLGAVASRAAWDDVYQQLYALIAEHKTTLVFVPSRRLAERVAHDLEERFAERPLPDGTVMTVAAHHGALSKHTRHSVEKRLQEGRLRAVVATASLELGIDIGDVELVCQIGSARALAVMRQRIGRARHTVGGIPKGRIFALTRDELVECAAAVRAMRRGRIDRGVFREAPLDILAQQIVAASASGPPTGLGDDAVLAMVRGAAPYATMPREKLTQVVAMLNDGTATRRGRVGAHVHRDRAKRVLRPRRGARLAAVTSGGAIPDKADYQVVEDTTEAVVGTLDEDFAIESMAGDVFLLGTTPWRVRRIENGRVRVVHAPGLAPSVPFWNGEGLARTEELSEETAALRDQLWARAKAAPDSGPVDGALRAELVAWLKAECALDDAGAAQVIDYVVEGARALGCVPTGREIVAERFFDEAGGMQLIIHAPFGARINRAWGLALRKKFCRTFDFELQAAATDDAILLSLGEQHSFPLDAIFGFVSAEDARKTIVQAALQAPVWETRWRWNATRSLAVLRWSQGRRTPPHLLRMRAADLLAAVFPQAAGCQDNHGGPTFTEELPLPDHPLVEETARDCLEEAMDVVGLERVLRAMRAGEVRCLARDTIAPSPFAHAILAANPYAYLDDAPLEERRTRAVSTTRPGELLFREGDLMRLDPSAVAAVVIEVGARPGSDGAPRDADELHDLLCTAVVLPAEPGFAPLFEVLVADGRAARLAGHPVEAWVAVDRAAAVRAAFPDARIEPPPPSEDELLAAEPAWEAEAARAAIVGGFMATSGPVRCADVAAALGMSPVDVEIAMAKLEANGVVLQGPWLDDDRGAEPAWCERRILQRIQRRTLGRMRAEVRPVTPAAFVRFLLRWQHVAPGTRLQGVEGLLRVVEQLEGFELPPAAWERDILPARVEGYRPEWLDELCFSGEVAWARLRPNPPDEPDPDDNADGEGAETRRARLSAGKVSLYLRSDAPWLVHRWPTAPSGGALLPSEWAYLSPRARAIAGELERAGAAFPSDLAARLGASAADVNDALWELVRAGAVACDGFAGLRALVGRAGSDDARRRRAPQGRFGLIARDLARPAGALGGEGPFGDGSPVELARLYLRRYGVVLRPLLARETAAPPWRDLVAVYRRLEARGEVRGGRFVNGMTGEQFALPEAVEALKALGRAPLQPEEIAVAGTDPLNLVGILTPGPRVPAVAGQVVRWRDGVPVRDLPTDEPTVRDDARDHAQLSA